MSSFERELIRGLKTLNLPGGIQKSSAILLHTKIVCNHLSWPSKNIYCISRQIRGSRPIFWAVQTYFEQSGHIFGFQKTMTQNLSDGPKSSRWQCHPTTRVFRPLPESWIKSAKLFSNLLLVENNGCVYTNQLIYTNLGLDTVLKILPSFRNETSI